VTERILQFPAWIAFAVILVSGVMRGTSFYVLGRWARSRGEQGRLPILQRPIVKRAETVVERVGAPAVTLSYFVYGLQASMNIASGLTRMPLARFLVALTLGAASWATFLTTLGVVALHAMTGGNGLLVLGGVLALLAAALLVHRLTRRFRALTVEEPATVPLQATAGV
jgi:membrane protein DedA with SNARE-associated domain